MRIRLAIAAILALFALGAAAPASAADTAAPVVVTSITTPVQHDDCGAEVDETGAYVNGYAWDHWTFGKNAGVSKSLITLLDGSGYIVRADPRPGYVIADGVQREWRFPPFTDEPC
jgi:opacity protein-like surface antigen